MDAANGSALELDPNDVAAAWAKVLGNTDDRDVQICVADLLRRGSIHKPLGDRSDASLRQAAGAHDLVCYILEAAGYTGDREALLLRLQRRRSTAKERPHARH